jgi:hypothetical protein
LNPIQGVLHECPGATAAPGHSAFRQRTQVTRMRQRLAQFATQADVYLHADLRMQASRSPHARSRSMKKLKIEDLKVTSFDTAPNEPHARGTVDGHAKPTLFITCRCEPTDPAMDCTYGCSHDTGCPNNCILISENACV